MIILASPNLRGTGTDIRFHVLSYSSTKIKRVCRSTMQAETYQLQLTVEQGDCIRACIADLNGVLDRRNWEASAAAFKHAVWLTDCNSCNSALLRPVQGKTTDKRLGIEVAALRQNLWRVPGQLVGMPWLDEDKPEDTTDSSRWIDTSVMLCDAFTKKMSAQFMVDAMRTGVWNIKQPEDAAAGKKLKSQSRAKSKEAKKAQAKAKMLLRKPRYKALKIPQPKAGEQVPASSE